MLAAPPSLNYNFRATALHFHFVQPTALSPPSFTQHGALVPQTQSTQFFGFEGFAAHIGP